MQQRILSFVTMMAVFCLLPSAGFALDKVRIGLSSVTGIVGSIWIAEEKKLFQKYGIDPEIILIGGGGARVVSSLIAGEIQFTTGAGDAIVRASLHGIDIAMVASIVTKGLQRVVVRPEITSPKDLKGRRIGITRFGSASHWVLRLMLDRWNIRSEEVQVIQIGSSQAMLVNLDKGAIDAAILSMPSFFIAAESGYRVLADLAEMDIYSLQNTLSTTRGFLKTRRDETRRFLKGYIEGIAYYKRHRQESLNILQKKLRIQSNQLRELKHLEKSYDLLATKYYDPAPYPSIEGVASLLQFLSEDNPKFAKLDPKSFVENSVVKEIEDSGFIKALYAK
jgi:NitT/TauT family transport system substrate-binding protein